MPTNREIASDISRAYTGQIDSFLVREIEEALNHKDELWARSLRTLRDIMEARVLMDYEVRAVKRRPWWFPW